MANTETQGKAAKIPSRAASLQRMLEIERKHKMERLQLQNPDSAPAPGRRGVSPASQTSSSGSSRASGLFLHHRSRESSQTRQQQPDDRRMSTVRNFTLPPLSIHTQPKKRVSLMPELLTANISEPKIQTQREPKKPDRNTLPSMVRAATAGHEPSNLKMVAFAAEDGNDSEGSSICHSPTWDDYGKKKKKKKEKDADTKRKRLTKEPPPVSMDNRPGMGMRATTDSTLTIQQLRQSLESGNSSSQLNTTSTEVPLPVSIVETVPRSPTFIGGVRLEREREAVLKRMANSRNTSVERPKSEMMLRSPPPVESPPATSKDSKRDAAPKNSYPPSASKNQSSRPVPRARRNSFGQGLIVAAGKLFTSKDKDSRERADSRASVSTSQTTSDGSDRGRQMSGSTATYSRGQSYDPHDRYAPDSEEPRRGAVSQPPAAWKDSEKKSRTISMLAIPPNSARDGSFSPFHSPQLKEDNFDFLDRPFSPATAPPVSPPASLSASVKAKTSPAVTPTPASPAVSSKKTFKEALKAGFRSSSATLDAKMTRRRSGTLDTLVDTEVEVSLPRRGSLPLQSHPVTAISSPALSAPAGVDRPAEQQQIGQARSGGSKDSGASSASSHPDTESLPASPMTTPEGSRPQSKRDSQAFRLDELKRVAPLSYENVLNQRGSPTLPARSSGYYSPKNAASPCVSVEKPRIEKPSGSPNNLVGREQHGRSSSTFKEELPLSQGFLTDELWAHSRKPLDPDQMSFTSALTSLDVKRSFTDLNSALQSPNGDVTPMSLEDATRGMAKKENNPMGFQFDLSNKNPTSYFSPTSPHQAQSPRGGQGRLPSSQNVQQSPRAWAGGSPNFPTQPTRKASDYLQEARKAAPASPRAPVSTTNSQASSPVAHNILLSGPRAFALSKPKQPIVLTTTTTTTTTTNTKQLRPSAAAKAAPADSTPLGAPMSKMLVECCHCKFYHDMPSRVYEAMARPDDVVKDKELGVSGQVTTCVKCPWCAHNMSTMCCAGYAAVVYLREKLHGP